VLSEIIARGQSGFGLQPHPWRVAVGELDAGGMAIGRASAGDSWGSPYEAEIGCTHVLI
jgi:hypothetical protein